MGLVGYEGVNVMVVWYEGEGEGECVIVWGAVPRAHYRCVAPHCLLHNDYDLELTIIREAKVV